MNASGFFYQVKKTQMTIEFVVSTIIPATPPAVYDTWMSSEGHSAMTGSPASISAKVGAEFDAWDGYIHGKNLELLPGKRIVQSWRTSEFSDDEPDSRIEIILEPVGGQTRLILRHTGLPPHGGQYEQGWVESYFEPMQEYFEQRSAE
jgi:activator of HSP90 ATPase